MARPKKVTFADALDIYLETCTLSELEGVEAAVRIWKRIRLSAAKREQPATEQQAALPLGEKHDVD